MSGRMAAALMAAAFAAAPADALTTKDFVVPQPGGFYDALTLLTGPCEPAPTLDRPKHGGSTSQSSWVESEFLSEGEVEPWGVIAPTTDHDDQDQSHDGAFPQPQNPRGPCVGHGNEDLEHRDYVTPVGAEHFLGVGINSMSTYRVTQQWGVCSGQDGESDFSPDSKWCDSGQSATYVPIKTVTFEIYTHCVYEVLSVGKGATVRRRGKNRRLGKAQPLLAKTILRGGDVVLPGGGTVVVRSGGVEMWLANGRFVMKDVSNCQLNTLPKPIRRGQRQPPPAPPTFDRGDLGARVQPRMRFLARTPDAGIQSVAGTRPRQAAEADVLELTVRRNRATRTTKVCTKDGRARVTATAKVRARTLVLEPGQCASVARGRAPRLVAGS